MYNQITLQRQLELFLLFTTSSAMTIFSAVLISCLTSRQRFLFTDQAYRSLFFQATFFHWFPEVIRSRISHVTKGLGRPRIWNVQIGACSSNTLLNNRLNAFNLSSGSSKHGPRYLQSVSKKLIWPVMFEVPCCNISWLLTLIF